MKKQGFLSLQKYWRPAEIEVAAIGKTGHHRPFQKGDIHGITLLRPTGSTTAAWNRWIHHALPVMIDWPCIPSQPLRPVVQTVFLLHHRVGYNREKSPRSTSLCIHALQIRPSSNHTVSGMPRGKSSFIADHTGTSLAIGPTDS